MKLPGTIQIISCLCYSDWAGFTEEATNADPNLTVVDYQTALKAMQQAKLNRERLIPSGLLLSFIRDYIAGLANETTAWWKLFLAAVLFTGLFHLSYVTFGQNSTQ